MAKRKYDGIVEAVHYASGNREIDWVRAYERRGPTYSDLVIIQRDELIRRIKAGQKFAIGSRKEYLSSTFDIKYPLDVVQAEGKDCLTFAEKAESSITITGLPVI